MISKETEQALILKLLDLSAPTIDANGLWECGKTYVIRTVTMIYLGKLEVLTETELLLSNCAWIPETSKWNEFLKGKRPNEMEPYKNNVIIGRQALLDATILDDEITIEVI